MWSKKMKKILIILTTYLFVNSTALAEDITVNVIVNMPNPEQEAAIKYLNAETLEPAETLQEQLEKEELKAEISRLPEVDNIIMEAAIQSQEGVIQSIKQEAERKTKSSLQLKNKNQ